MKSISRAVLPLLAATAVAAPTFAQKLSQERGNIVSTDWRAMQVEIKDPKGRVGTWKVRRDAQVVFTDKKDQFPNPKLADLRAPMYVHFTFEGGTTPGIISRFEVVEVGFEPSRGGPGLQQTGVITNLDANIGHVEVNLGSGPHTFAVEPKEQLRNFRIGDRIRILIEPREVSRQVVTQIQRQ